MSKRRINLIGKKFNRLTVIEEAGTDKRRNALWKCNCDCGNEVIKSAKNLKNNDAKSCGCLHRERTVKFNKRGFSEETKRKMSKAKMGFKHTKEARIKMSKNRPNVSGEKNPMFGKGHLVRGKNNPMYGKCGPLAPAWKGGTSCEPYCHEWSFKDFKDMIKERDGNKCLNPDCFGNIHRLCVHHVDYNKKHCEPENLITLCVSCNARANYERDWHQAWYSAIIYRRGLFNEL